MVDVAEGATLVDIRSIITPAQTVAKVAQPIVQGMAQPTPTEDTGDYLDKILKLAETFDNILSKGDKLEGMFARIAEKKGVGGRDEEPNNPVLQQKIQARETGRPLPGQALNGVKEEPTSNDTVQPREEIKMQPQEIQINETFVEECVERVVELIKGLDDEWKKQSIEELTAWLDKPMIGKQIRTRVKKELIEIIKGATQ